MQAQACLSTGALLTVVFLIFSVLGHIRGIRSCGIEALSNLAPHLQKLHNCTIASACAKEVEIMQLDCRKYLNDMHCGATGIQSTERVALHCSTKRTSVQQ
jgi:hypothetical protein